MNRWRDVAELMCRMHTRSKGRKHVDMEWLKFQICCFQHMGMRCYWHHRLLESAISHHERRLRGKHHRELNMHAGNKLTCPARCSVTSGGLCISIMHCIAEGCLRYCVLPCPPTNHMRISIHDVDAGWRGSIHCTLAASTSDSQIRFPPLIMQLSSWRAMGTSGIQCASHTCPQPTQRSGSCPAWPLHVGLASAATLSAYPRRRPVWRRSQRPKWCACNMFRRSMSQLSARRGRFNTVTFTRPALHQPPPGHPTLCS